MLTQCSYLVNNFSITSLGREILEDVWFEKPVNHSFSGYLVVSLTFGFAGLEDYTGR